MALPPRERPLNFRISSELYHSVFDSVGEASACWKPEPGNQLFNSEKAADVAVRLCLKIADEMDDLRESLQKSQG